MPHEHPTKEVRPSKSNEKRYIFVIILVAIVSAPYVYYSLTQTTPTTMAKTSTTTSYSFTLHTGDLYYTGERSCWYLNETNRIVYALFNLNVTNSLNVPTDYVNVSFYAHSVTFSNGFTEYNSSMQLIAGASHSVNLSFIFGIPLNGSVYHQALPSVSPSSSVVEAFLAIRIFVSEAGHIEAIPLTDYVYSASNTPACTV